VYLLLNLHLLLLWQHLDLTVATLLLRYVSPPEVVRFLICAGGVCGSRSGHDGGLVLRDCNGARERYQLTTVRVEELEQRGEAHENSKGANCNYSLLLCS